MDLQGVLNGRSVQLDALDGLERPPDLVPAEVVRHRPAPSHADGSPGRKEMDGGFG